MPSPVPYRIEPCEISSRARAGSEWLPTKVRACDGSTAPATILVASKRCSGFGLLVRTFIWCSLFLICLGEPECDPEVGRAFGNPAGRAKRQDQQGEGVLDAGPRAFSVLAANVGNIDAIQCDGALHEFCNAAQEARVIRGIARVRPDIALLSETITRPELPRPLWARGVGRLSFDAQRRAQKKPPFWSVPLKRQTWDHVLSEGSVGRCVTLDAAEKFPGFQCAARRRHSPTRSPRAVLSAVCRPGALT